MSPPHNQSTGEYMKYTILAFMLTACTADPQGLRTPQIDCDSVCGIIENANKTTVQIVDRDVALNILNGDYK
jgi:starvation-inducible outer membrane lipoprotein